MFQEEREHQQRVGKAEKPPHEPTSKRAAERIGVSVVDRRRVGAAGAAGPATEPDLKPAYVQQLEDRVRRAEATLRARVESLEAETRRSRERLHKDLERRFEEKERGLLKEVLDILDDLDRACAMTSEVAAVADGLALIGSRLHQFLTARGCRRLDPAGQPFDPATMEAVALQDGPQGQVVAVYQAGILQGEVLLRPAKVAVGNGGPPAPDGDE